MHSILKTRATNHGTTDQGKSYSVRKAMSLALCVIFFFAQRASACDVCALYTNSYLQGLEAGKFRLSAAEQYTSTRTRADDRETMGNSQARSVSFTQFSAAYDISNDWSAQLILPIIRNDAERMTDGSYRRDIDFGVSDISILIFRNIISRWREDGAYNLGMFLGIKAPTGDSEGLRRAESELSDAPASPSNHDIGHKENDAHDSHSSLLHALALRHQAGGAVTSSRVLTLGSGSWDVPLGLGGMYRYQRAFFLGNAQYTIRNEGDYNYEFGDDMLFNVGPATYLALADSYSVALRASFTGELKESDKSGGSVVAASRTRNYYMGPEAIVTLTDLLLGQLAIDLPISTGGNAHILPNWRLRTAFAIRF